MSDRARVSIVIPCRNEARHVRQLLDSILQADLEGIELEVIVADGMSDDGTSGILREYERREPRIRTIANPRRIVSSGLNAAIRAAGGDIVIRMDAHTEYDRDYVRRCVEVLRRTQADNVGGPARTRAEGLVARAISAAFHSPFSTGGARFHDENYEGYVDTVPYGCWKKSTLMEIGLFDESLVRNQDDELNYRLLRAGGRIWQSPAIVSYYRTRSTLRALARQYFQYGFWKVAVIRKYGSLPSLRLLVPGFFVLSQAALLLGAAALAAWGTAWRWPAVLCGVEAGLYGAAAVAMAAAAARQRGWSLLPALPVVFATYHLSYGLGFLAGCFLGASRTTGRASGESMFTRLSR